MPNKSFLLTALVAASLAAQEPPPAKPVDAIAAIVDAFKTHQVVAISDAHGNEQNQAFIKSLIRDPKFAATVNDIVIEFGNAGYQSIIDRFVRGERVSHDSLRLVWQNTTIPNEIPVDAEFFSVVRSVNATLPRERKIRLLLGDPPIDWSAVRTREDHFRWLAMRDSHPAALITLEVLAKQRRALLVYGHLHYQRKNVLSNLDMYDWRMQTIVSLLESATPTKIFSIWQLGDELKAVQPDVASWKAPSMAIIRGTTLGTADINAFQPSPMRMKFEGDKPAPVPRDQWRALRAEDQFDAVLYLGPNSAMTQMPLSAKICSDRRYIEERLRRIALTGIPPTEAERVKKRCGG